MIISENEYNDLVAVEGMHQDDVAMFIDQNETLEGLVSDLKNYFKLDESYYSERAALQEIVEETSKDKKSIVPYFEYGERFDAKNLNAAEDKFLDRALGGAFADFIKVDQKLSDAEVKINVIEVLQEIDDKSNGYVKEVSKLENGMTMSYEIWMTEEEEYPFLGQLTIVR